MRIGIGYDIHHLVPERPLILAGLTIPFDKGLLGHSDADVILHALGDAILGAAALGDLGQHFPDTDPQYAGVSGSDLMSHIIELIDELNLVVSNIDINLLAEKPRLSQYREAMRENIATLLKLTVDKVSLKFKTNEGLGEIGRQEAMAAQAVVLLISK